MNIKKAKEDIKNTVRAYLKKNDYGQYSIPSIRQRPMLLMGPPGIGKTQIMQQIAQECNIGLVAYTITHHTRQSAVGLPFIKEKTFDGKSYSVTEYTTSISIWKNPAKKKAFFLSTKLTVFLKHLLRQCCNFYSAKLSEIRLSQKDGLSLPQATHQNTTEASTTLTS